MDIYISSGAPKENLLDYGGGVKLQDIGIMLAVNGKKKIIGEFFWRACPAEASDLNWSFLKSKQDKQAKSEINQNKT